MTFRQLFFMLPVALLTFPTGTNAAQGPGLNLPARPYAETTAAGAEKVLKGAANLTELGQALLQAFQANDVGLLSSYFPSDQQLALLRKKGSRNMKAFLEKLTAEAIRHEFQEGFSSVRQQSTSQSLNWSELTFSEVRAGRPAAGSRMLFPVALRLQNKANHTITISFEALRLQNRYYLFRRVQPG